MTFVAAEALASLVIITAPVAPPVVVATDIVGCCGSTSCPVTSILHCLLHGRGHGHCQHHTANCVMAVVTVIVIAVIRWLVVVVAAIVIRTMVSAGHRLAWWAC